MKIKYLPILLIANANAGVYLDLDVGMHLNRWEGRSCNYISADIDKRTSSCQMQSVYISDENPLGSVRLGYKTNKYKLLGIKIRGRAYLGHISSILDRKDRGLTVFMTGITLE